MSGRLVAAGVAVFGVFSVAAVAAPSQDVTLKVDRFYEQEFGVWRLRFTGVIPSGTADEYVVGLFEELCPPAN